MLEKLNQGPGVNYEGTVKYGSFGEGKLEGFSSADAADITALKVVGEQARPVRYVVVGQDLYIDRAEVAAMPTDQGQVFLARLAGELRWSRYATARMLTMLFDPRTVLEVLAKTAPVSVRSEGTTTTARFEDPRSSFGYLGANVIEVTADSSGGFQALRAESGDATVEYRVTGSGDGVAVTVPPVDQLAPTKTIPPTTRPDATAPYADVRSGREGNSSWVLQKAPGTSSTTCWRVVVDNVPGPPRCVLPAQPGETDPSEIAKVVASSGNDAPIDVEVAVLPSGGNDPRWTMFDLSAAKGTIVDNNVVIYSGPKEPMPIQLTFRSGDETVTCLRGVLTSVSEAERLSDADRLVLRESAYLCELG